MYSNSDFTGASLPQDTICLTFDDGPGQTDGSGVGPRTLELSQYLSDRNIPATFFMVGKFASDLPDVLPAVEGHGHLIANHTYDHPNLVQYRSVGGDVAAQITRTDALIRNWIDAPTVFFRPPYGSWNSAVASELNGHLTASLSHFGPIGWDIDGGDWDFWRNGGSPSDCAVQYLGLIQNQGRGIILNHDCTADQESVRRGNRTYEMMQILIPQLQQLGYAFLRLDQIPGIPGAEQSRLAVALKGSNGQYVSPQQGGGGAVIVNGPRVGPWELLIVEDLYVGKVALRSSTGHYISPQGGGGGGVLANGPAVGDWEPLDLISMGNNKAAFRTFTGHFLSCDQGSGSLLTAVPWLSIDATCVFEFEYV